MTISREIRDLEQQKFVDVNSEPAVRITTGEELDYIDIASDTLFYFGNAAIGSLGSEAKWKIKRLTITGPIVKVEYADGDSLYDNIWDNRGSLTYV